MQAEDRGFAAQKISGSSSTILIFNNAKPPFDDVRARQAVAYAIDKDLINERAYDGVRVPSYSGFAARLARTTTRTPRRRSTTRRRRPSSSRSSGGLDFTIVCIPTPEADEILNIIKALGEDVGMNITLESQEQGAYVNRMFSKGGDFEAGCFRSSHFIEPDAIRPGLTTDDAGNLAFYSNPEVDQLLDEARQTADFEERKEKYFEVQEITAEEVPLITTLYDLFGNVYDETPRRAAASWRAELARAPSSPASSTPWADGSAVGLTPPTREDLNHHAHRTQRAPEAREAARCRADRELPHVHA